VAFATGPFHHGHPAEYARRKAAIFAEGGPAIVEVEVPASVVALALNFIAEVEFWPGIGLEELLAGWPSLSKRIIDVGP
jgi:hypothetical protein